MNFRERKTFRYEEENYDFAMKPIASNMISVLLRAVLGFYSNMKKSEANMKPIQTNTFQYYCEQCWASIHSRPGREFHKPLVKEGADRLVFAHNICVCVFVYLYLYLYLFHKPLVKEGADRLVFAYII